MKRVLLITAVTAGLLSVTAPAAYADPSSNFDLGTQYGSVLRGKLTEHADGSGNWIRVYGSGSCSSTTSDRDFVYSSMPPGWNDEVSRFYDYNYCDTKLYWDSGANVSGKQTAWRNGGSSGLYVGSDWNDETSSFALS